jgi:hypothetical protein
MRKQKDVIANQWAIAGGVIAALACMYVLGPFLLPTVNSSPITITHVLVFWLGCNFGYGVRFVLYHAIAWLIMSSDDYYYFRRWFFNID